MRLETFSYLPPMNDAQMRGQIQHIINQGFAPSIEYTDDPGPFNTYWSMWSLPMFDVRDAAGVVFELEACKRANPSSFVKINGYDPVRQGQAVSFVAYRPE